MCDLCHGTKIVHPEIMKGVTVVQPCPNCTTFVHDHYEKELAECLQSNQLVTASMKF